MTATLTDELVDEITIAAGGNIEEVTVEKADLDNIQGDRQRTFEAIDKEKP